MYKQAFTIAKYPTTNAQFAKFVEDGGYKQKRWWSESGWQEKLYREWTEPLHWYNEKLNGVDQPVVGITEYEALAFCNWLSEASSELIMLPTEQQWQRAAQGDDRRNFPCGNKWDCNRCNNSVNPCKNHTTTPVTQYEGTTRGDSFFGVVDMAGNTWEQCLIEYNPRHTELKRTVVGILKGCSYIGNSFDSYRADYRQRKVYYEFDRSSDCGFRFCHS